MDFKIYICNLTKKAQAMGYYRYTELSYKITTLISHTCCLGSSGLTNT